MKQMTPSSSTIIKNTLVLKVFREHRTFCFERSSRRTNIPKMLQKLSPNGAKSNKKHDKKQVDSLPIKFEFIETEFFKELDKMQKGLSVFQGDHLLSFADLSKLEEKFLEM